MTTQNESLQAPITRETAPGLRAIDIPRGAITETQITSRALPGESSPDVFRRLALVVRERGAEIVKLDVFGPPSAREASLAAIAEVLGSVDFPVSWMEEMGEERQVVSGALGIAIAGTPVETLRLGDEPVGRVYECDGSRICFLGDVRPLENVGSREEQARGMFEQMETRLALAGMKMTDIIRTWLYNDDILAWYDEFNAVRTKFFKERGVFEKMVPASTGVRGCNSGGSALIASVWAVQPGPGVNIEPVGSPLQCSARDYGSSFSRAVAVTDGNVQYVTVSGTASIEPEGATAFVDDLEKQVDLTVRVIAAILDSRGMTFADVTRAIAYFNRDGCGPMFDRYCEEHGIPSLFAVVVENDICRDDLLFELELDAVKSA